MKIANNYSNIKNRDKKLYSVSGTTISSTGLSYRYIKVLSIFMTIFNVIGVLICLVTGKFLYWPFTETMELKPLFIMFFIGIPFLLTIILLYTKVQNYVLLDFLLAYFKPKRVRDEQGKVIRYSKYSQDTFVERII